MLFISYKKPFLEHQTFLVRLFSYRRMGATRLGDYTICPSSNTLYGGCDPNVICIVIKGATSLERFSNFSWI